MTGTAGNDTFVALDDGQNGIAGGATLSAGDSINGGAGVDTLNITHAGTTAAIAQPVISNIEVLNIRATTAATFNAAGITGLTTVTNTSSAGTLAVNNLASIVTVNLNGSATDTTIGYAATTIAGLADVAAVNVAGVTAGTLLMDGIETVNLTASGTKSTLTAFADAQLKTLTITGAADLNLGTALPASATKVDASAFTGKLTVVSGSAATAITGGTGNDTIDIGALVPTAKLDGGAGTDTLKITLANANPGALIPAFTAGTAVNFEAVQLSDTTEITANVTADLTKLPGVTSVTVDLLQADGAQSLTLTGFASAGTLQFNQSFAGTGGVVAAVTNATTAGNNSDVLNVVFNGVASTNVTVGNIDATGVENINITSGSQGTAVVTNTISALTDTSVQNVTVTGANNLTITTALSSGIQKIDASALTGILSVSGSTTAGAPGVLILGGTKADVIVDGAGNDIITGNAGADGITLSSGGADLVRFDLSKDLVAGNLLKASADTIANATLNYAANLTSGDRIDLAGITLSSGTGTTVALTAGVDDLGGTLAARFVSGALNTFANISAGANGGALVLSVTGVAGNISTTAADLATAVASLATTMTTTTANEKVIIALTDGSNNTALYLFQEGAVANGVQATELTLIGMTTGATNALTAGDIV